MSLQDPVGHTVVPGTGQSQQVLTWFALAVAREGQAACPALLICV